MSVADKLVEALLDAATRHSGEEAAPVALLWTDKNELWRSVIPKLQQAIPSLVCFGPYNPESRSGPAIWIRCMVAGVLEQNLGGVPVIYLPGVERRDLRNAEDAPHSLQPLIALQYSGTIWSHPNGKDWTPAAFLINLGLEVASDDDTKAALQERLPRLLGSEIEDLKALGRLDALKIRNLGSDWPLAILDWMEQPTRRDDDWNTFRSACQSQYGFDPESDGDLIAAEKLAQANVPWNAVWTRFAHAPRRYPGVVNLLRKVTPPGLFDRDEGYPCKNAEAESLLRAELVKAAKKDAATARKRIGELEAEHGKRRQWVWCELGEAPLAKAIEHLAACAHATSTALGATAVEDLILKYTKFGWPADQAAWMAYAAVDSNDAMLIGDLLRVIYLPWLQSAAEIFTTLCQRSPLGSLWAQVADPAPGECLLFADGLRYDVGKLLEAELTRVGALVELTPRVCGLPSVTATAKPAVSPIADELTGTATGTDFQPTVKATGKPLTAETFRDMLADMGIQVLDSSDTGDPEGRGWTESGALDSLGHNEGAPLARRIPDEVKMLRERICALLDAGWKTVRVVTDHGWLWMPGKLPKVELPAYLTECRWSRCAALKNTATTDLPTIRWHYDPSVDIVVPPGVSCFRAGHEYSHGGLSLQECVIPVLTVSRQAATVLATIDSVSWTGLRCRIQVSGGKGLQADIRTKAAAPESSVAFDAKAVDEAGQVSLAAKDDHEGEAAFVVLIDGDGRVVAKEPTAIGG